MKLYKRNKKRRPNEGEIRNIHRFAFIPKWIGDELVWLETYIVKQKMIITKRSSWLDLSIKWKWKDIEFIRK